jgi:hypothetical protein
LILSFKSLSIASFLEKLTYIPVVRPVVIGFFHVTIVTTKCKIIDIVITALAKREVMIDSRAIRRRRFCWMVIEYHLVSTVAAKSFLNLEEKQFDLLSDFTVEGFYH